MTTDTPVIQPVAQKSSPLVLVLSLLLGAVCLLTANAYYRLYNDDPKNIVAQSITLKSPNSPYVVQMNVSSDRGGIYITRAEIKGEEYNPKGFPVVSIYNTESEGAVIGVYGEGRKRLLDVAISAKNGGSIQFVDANNKHYELTEVLTKKIGNTGHVGDAGQPPLDYSK